MTPDSPLAGRLRALAMDLRWTTCPLALRAFAAVDPVLWEATNHDPLALLRRVHPERLAAADEDGTLGRLVAAAEGAARRQADARTWFERRHGRRRLRVAYFCSEFALHESLQQYSGGLGVLAGDHVKSCSDLGVPLVGVGLLYRHGYYVQELRRDGSTRVLYPQYANEDMPVVDTGVMIGCPLGNQLVWAGIWRMQVGRVPLILLDADLPGQPRSHRRLTEGLYKGEPDLRLRQQVLLGVGGILALEALGMVPTSCT